MFIFNNMKKQKLNLILTHSDGKRQLHLFANDMNEMVEKIIDWQTMDDISKEIYERKGKLKSELDSGWYYIEK
jgi:hypothetical protein